MKKGFSLVEIMIVMVIIGIIVALGIKGGALINASRIRAEIAKLRNFETGFAGYFLKNNAMPPYTGNDNDSSNLVLYNTDVLVTRGVISSEDVPATFSQNQQPWTFCKNIATEDNGTYFTPAGFAVANAGAGACTSTYTLNNELICNIETILDDGNLYKGAGRVTSAGVSISDNCDAAVNKSTYSSYIYVAFSPNSQIPLKKSP